jgi:hypothetical protein
MTKTLAFISGLWHARRQQGADCTAQMTSFVIAFLWG